ncbi:MAG: hypothetical protein EAZ55_12485 [Cytophagales bacterium]|nr:MAG: hypothetical protein EAZ55_12485 [Cytophagales bacterium]
MDTQNLDAEKKELIRHIQQINNREILSNLNSTLLNTEKISEYQELVDDIVAKNSIDTTPPLTHITIPEETPVQRIEKKMAPFMFWFSAATLVLLGIAVAKYWEADETPNIYELDVIIFLCMYPIFIIEYILLVYNGALTHLTRTERLTYTFYSLIPQMRFGRKPSSFPHYIWLPYYHWCEVNESLFVNIKRRFVVPMLFISFFIIPILLIDLRYKEKIIEYIADIDLYLAYFEAFVWLAFAFEFILLFSIAPIKLDYAKKHWIEIIIIFLPLLAAFLPSVGFLRVLRLNNLVRVYRFKSVFTRFQQALMVASFMQRILHPNPTTQIISLQKKIRENHLKQEELEMQLLKALERYKKYQIKKQRKAALKNEAFVGQKMNITQNS